MPISGLVVTLNEDSRSRTETLDEIGREPRITLGVLAANRLAIVLDTKSSEEDRQLWDWLGGLSGVSFLDVTFVGFEPATESLPVEGTDVSTSP